MLNVRQADDHLYGKSLFTWLSLVMSIMVSFRAILFPTRCLPLTQDCGVNFEEVRPVGLKPSCFFRFLFKT